MTKRSNRCRNVYLHIPEEVHVEARTLGLRLHRTVDSIYLEAILRTLREHGVDVTPVDPMDLTTPSTGSTVG